MISNQQCGRFSVIKTVVALAVLTLIFEIIPIIRYSYVYNENGRLASGLIALQRFDFSSFRVNPPLPDAVAALPARLANAYCPTCDELSLNPLDRNEYVAGDVFIYNNDNHLVLLRLGRFCELVFTLIGVVATYYYAYWLFNARCAVVAVALWFFSPMMNGHGALISSDVAGAALAIATCAMFHYSLKVQRDDAFFLTGLVLGLAELCKSTLIVLYPIFITLWLAYSLSSIPHRRRIWSCEIKRVFLHCFAVSILTLNLGYLFEGSFTRLGEFPFQSQLLSNRHEIDQNYRLANNRFKDSILGKIPVPLPENYVLGIDVQRFDFEVGLQGASYMRGRYANSGWYSYYLYALLVKTPVGTILLFLLALGALALSKRYRLPACDELALWAPGLTILLFVSSQNGFSVHSRYILPALPCFFVAVSRLGLVFSPSATDSNASTPKARCVPLILCGLWTVASFASAYPDELVYFNELAAFIPTPCAAQETSPPVIVDADDKLRKLVNPGLSHGRRHLLDSNLDWGQNDLSLVHWLQARPEITEIKTALWGSYPVELFPIPATEVTETPASGWVAISVNRLYGRDGKFRELLELRPYYVLNNCVYVFHISGTESYRSDETRE